MLGQNVKALITSKINTGFLLWLLRKNKIELRLLEESIIYRKV